MSLNILPHKSWNVWNRKNIQKVEDDEKSEILRQNEVMLKAAASETEARYTILRKRADIRRKRRDELRERNEKTEATPFGSHENDSKLRLVDPMDKRAHVNLFENFADQVVPQKEEITKSGILKMSGLDAEKARKGRLKHLDMIVKQRLDPLNQIRKGQRNLSRHKLGTGGINNPVQQYKQHERNIPQRKRTTMEILRDKRLLRESRERNRTRHLLQKAPRKEISYEK